MRPLRILKIAWISFSSLLAGLMALVGIVVYGMYYLEDPTRGEFLRNLVFEERAFEVTVDLVVEGEPLRITRTINCVPYYRTGEFNFGQSWKASLESFGKRLKSGGAVIVVAPPLCGLAELSYWEDSRSLPIHADYITLIRWVDDPDHPSVVEDYIARGYFGRPDARVQYQGISAQAVPYQSSAMELEELDWFSVGRSNAFRPRKGEEAYGYVAWPITESEWSKIEDVASEIRAIDQISVLPLQLARQLLGHFSPQIHYDWIDRGQGLVPGPGPISYGGSLRMKRDLAQIMPLSLDDGTFESNKEEQGYLILYPIASNQPEDTDLSETKFRIDGQAISIKSGELTRVTTIYVPETKTIYQLVPLLKYIPRIAKN